MNTTYHVTWRSIGLVFMLVLVFLVPLEVASAFIFFYLLAPSLVNRFSGISTFAFVTLGLLLVIIFISVAIILIYRIGTFLRLSSDGLEYHRWPFGTITCRWNEIENISQGNAMGLSFATLMIPRNEVGREIPVGGGVLGSARYKLVPLNDFHGWPDGDLMVELKGYAPNLFRNE